MWMSLHRLVNLSWPHRILIFFLFLESLYLYHTMYPSNRASYLEDRWYKHKHDWAKKYLPGAAHRSNTWSPGSIPKAITAAPEDASIPYIWYNTINQSIKKTEIQKNSNSNAKKLTHLSFLVYFSASNLNMRWKSVKP